MKHCVADRSNSEILRRRAAHRTTPHNGGWVSASGNLRPCVATVAAAKRAAEWESRGNGVAAYWQSTPDGVIEFAALVRNGGQQVDYLESFAGKRDGKLIDYVINTNWGNDGNTSETAKTAAKRRRRASSK